MRVNEVPALPVPPGRADGSGPDGGAAEGPIARHAARCIRGTPAGRASCLHRPSPLGDEPPWEVPVGPWREESRSGVPPGRARSGRADGRGGDIARQVRTCLRASMTRTAAGRDLGTVGKPVPYRHLRERAACNTMSGASMRRRTQVAKGEVCKTSIQRFESARRLHLAGRLPDQVPPTPALPRPSPGRIIQFWTSTY